MREVEASRFVQTYPEIVEQNLSPAAILDAEGSFEVRETENGGDRITVGGYGLTLVFAFTTREDGIEYEQIKGPLETLRTTLTYAPENEGTRLAARSEVAVGGPGVLDRLAAWKRRGELERALAGVAERCQ
ncbi:polyketide cyclase [Halobacteriales archaeon QH_10_67_13]|nr:MAG: polyketide cyclase [Halobacteriales archaeon QH_10_67_13]